VFKLILLGRDSVEACEERRGSWISRRESGRREGRERVQGFVGRERDRRVGWLWEEPVKVEILVGVSAGGQVQVDWELWCRWLKVGHEPGDMEGIHRFVERLLWKCLGSRLEVGEVGLRFGDGVEVEQRCRVAL
jgi:hypothetical protein